LKQNQLEVKTLRLTSCYIVTSKKLTMARGTKVERHSVSEQPHELAYEAKKQGTTAKKVETAKKSAGSNQRSAVESKLAGNK